MSRPQSIPYSIPFVYRYSTGPRFDRRYTDTLFNLVTGKSVYSFRNTSSRDQPLGHIVHIMMMSYRVGPEIPLGQLHRPPVTLGRVVQPKHSYGVRELHTLTV